MVRFLEGIILYLHQLYMHPCVFAFQNALINAGRQSKALDISDFNILVILLFLFCLYWKIYIYKRHWVNLKHQIINYNYLLVVFL